MFRFAVWCQPMSVRHGSTLRLILLALTLACVRRPPGSAEDLERFKRGLAGITATCAEAKGQVEVRRIHDTRWEPMPTGGVLQTGDEVRTGPESFARIELLGGGRLELEERASLMVETARPAVADAKRPDGTPVLQQNRVRVGTGVVRGFMPEVRNAGEHFEMLIDSGTGAPVRLAAEPGNRAVAFRLTRGENKTELAVTQGQAQIIGDGGQARAVRSGQVVDVAAGSVGEFADLIDFPQSLEPGIDARFQFTPKLVIGLSWRAVPGATGYRVQVANDLSFETPEAVFDVSGTEYEFSPRQPGLHVWRVAARDAHGRFGEYGFARRIFCGDDQARDLLIAPEDGMVVRYSDVPPRIPFSWESAGDARSYRLVVASGPILMQQKVTTLVTSAQRLELDGLVAGTYYWGVFVDDGPTPISIFSRPRKFVIQKTAGAKMKVPKAISEWGK